MSRRPNSEKLDSALESMDEEATTWGWSLADRGGRRQSEGTWYEARCRTDRRWRYDNANAVQINLDVRVGAPQGMTFYEGPPCYGVIRLCCTYFQQRLPWRSGHVPFPIVDTRWGIPWWTPRWTRCASKLCLLPYMLSRDITIFLRTPRSRSLTELIGFMRW